MERARERSAREQEVYPPTRFSLPRYSQRCRSSGGQSGPSSQQQQDAAESMVLLALQAAEVRGFLGLRLLLVLRVGSF